jgi:hypothetical protein
MAPVSVPSSPRSTCGRKWRHASRSFSLLVLRFLLLSRYTGPGSHRRHDIGRARELLESGRSLGGRGNAVPVDEGCERILRRLPPFDNTSYTADACGLPVITGATARGGAVSYAASGYTSSRTRRFFFHVWKDRARCERH